MWLWYSFHRVPTPGVTIVGQGNRNRAGCGGVLKHHYFQNDLSSRLNLPPRLLRTIGITPSYKPSAILWSNLDTVYSIEHSSKSGNSNPQVPIRRCALLSSLVRSQIMKHGHLHGMARDKHQTKDGQEHEKNDRWAQNPQTLATLGRVAPGDSTIVYSLLD